MEKQFYKTSGRRFFKTKTSKTKKDSSSNKLYDLNQQRIHSSDINKKYYTSNNFYYSNKNHNETNIIKLLQQKINEIENELEHNENTFTHNKKILQKRLEEKDQEIQKLTKIIAEKDENNLKEKELGLIINKME